MLAAWSGRTNNKVSDINLLGLLTLVIRKDRLRALVGLILKIKVKWHKEFKCKDGGAGSSRLFLCTVRRHLFLILNKTSL